MFSINTLHATLLNEDIKLNPNMTLHYVKAPEDVNNISDMFLEGSLYGRLRMNSFQWDWDHDNYPSDPNGKLMDDRAMGLGGSFVYKTANLSGWSSTLGLYTTQNPGWFREDASNVGYVKSGKDTFSRSEVLSGNGFGMTVLAQAYIQYDIRKSSIILGRQLFESVYTASNDTKMIPNTFDGVTAKIDDLPQTKIKLAYLDKQKLRDHTKAHDVIAYAGGSAPDKFRHNDDSGVNRNLTVARIGDDNELIITTLENTSIKNLKVNVNYAIVPDVLSNLVLESHYTIPLSKTWKIVPGFRYMQQFDHLNANYNVANILTVHDGYNEGSKQSLDTNLLAVRVDIKNKAFLARLGYSEVADKADIVTPWRGFPTGGFTRAMAQVNWNANTRTYMARVGYDFGKANMIDGFSIMARYAIQDTDDNKVGVAGDANIVHIDARQNLGENLELKLRLGFVNYEDGIRTITGTTKPDLSYSEYRFEINYFF